MAIEEVDLSKCMPNKDFGCGFCTILPEEQAWKMARQLYSEFKEFLPENAVE